MGNLTMNRLVRYLVYANVARFVIACLQTQSAQAQTHSDWIARSTVPTDYGLTGAITVAANGDVYAFRSWADSLFGPTTTKLVKYSPSGQLIWTSEFADSTSPRSMTWDLSVDAAGSLVTCGGGNVVGDSLAGIVISRFSSTGNRLWHYEYHGREGEQGASGALVRYDGAGGIYVAGESKRGFNYDCVFMRLDTLGRPLWTFQYDGPGHSYDQPTDLALGVDGSLYAALISRDSSLDYCVLKFCLSGAIEYETRYDGPTGDIDRPHRIAVDDSDCVYVTGESGADFHEEFATLKLAADGHIDWVRRYVHPPRTFGGAWALGISPAGGCYVAGYSGGQGKNYDTVVLRYSSSGDLLWEYRYDSGDSDNPRDLLALPTGGCLVSGETEGENWGMLSFRLSDDGKLVWADNSQGSAEFGGSISTLGFASPNFVYGCGTVGRDLVIIRFSDDVAVPRGFLLEQNFPNPFNRGTTIPFELTQMGDVTVKVYNILGQEVSSQSLGQLGEGPHSYYWNATLRDGQGAASGVYFLRLQVGRDSEVRKMVLLK